MIEINNESFVSIEDLNRALEQLPEKDSTVSIYLKNEINRIDIVFIAGLVLWNRMYQTRFALFFKGSNIWHNENSPEIVNEETGEIITKLENQDAESDINRKNENARINELENRNKNRVYEVKQYLKQLESLYGINFKEVFTFLGDDSKKETGHNIEMLDVPLYVTSKSFSPILYITKENFGYFFKENGNQYVNKIKNEYITSLKLNAFVSRYRKNGFPYFDETKTKGEEKTDFDIFFKSLTQRLQRQPAIYAFIFLVLYSKLALHKDYSNKRTSLKSEEFRKFTNKLFEFTRQYVQGLYELAKNIYEHSEEKQGIITIRAYDDENEKERLLETHVFDFGKEGIIAKLKKNTIEKENKEKNTTIKGYYKNDLGTLENDFELKDFIIQPKGKELKQQNVRHIRHFGIIRLYNITKGIEKMPNHVFDGEMYVSTNKNTERDYFPNKTLAKNKTLCKGTSYCFQIPFKPDKIEEVVLQSSSRSLQIGALGNKEALTNLMKKEILQITLDELDIQDKIYKDFLFNISIDESITKEKINEFYQKFEKLKSISTQNIIAVNLKFLKGQNKTTENVFEDSSDLLRFLSLLSYEYDQPFIIYNLDYEKYREMLQLNQICYRGGGQAYWHEARSILLYVKLDNFYFADILFGNERNEFRFVNSVIDKTFPNTITLIEKNYSKVKRKEIEEYQRNLNENNNLNCFFKDNMLVPFDTLLCSVMKDDSDKVITDDNGAEKLFPLFNHNLWTSLNNPLLVPEETKQLDTYDSKIALKNYISIFDGYHITDTHFKIGNKLHSRDFYYAKRLFQNSFYAARLAMLLARKIEEEIKPTDNILLIGYEMYSELLLSLISKFLKDKEYKNIKYFVSIDNEERFKFKPDNEDEMFFRDKNGDNLFLECKAVIIVPIASTGSTAVKIRENLKKELEGKLKQKFPTLKPSEIKILVTKTIDFRNSYNILKAKDENFQSIIESNQEDIITLKAEWHELENCPLCGFGIDGFEYDTKTLFGTDKSYLTPALIFNKPKGKQIKDENKEIDKVFAKENNYDNIDDREILLFNQVKFENSLKYKQVKRNNEFYLFSVNSPKFINENRPQIENWLKDLQQQEYVNSDGEKWKITPTDRVILLAPCHETNSEFLTLVNENVFNSSATIIHHQSDVDYSENFRILNKRLIDKDTKVFYVDDNLISGKQFYEIYHLFRDLPIVGKEELDGAILLRDASSQEIHDRFLRCVHNCRVFVAYNLPPALSFDSKKPLEHERKRYEDLRNYALHDVLAKIFDQKELELNVEEYGDYQKVGRYKINTKNLEQNFGERYAEYQQEQLKIKIREEEKKKAKAEKEKRHLKMFTATHMVYDYFKGIEHTIENVNQVKENELLVHCFGYGEENKIENRITLLKVLSQYPFLLYKPMKEWVFEWHRKWLNDILQDNFKNKFIQYSTTEEFPFLEFQELKFIIRRAVFLDNFQIVDKSFLSFLSAVFSAIRLRLEYQRPITNETRDGELPLNERNNLSILDKENLEDFQIFLVHIYLELVHKNGWAAVRLLKNLNLIENDFSTPAGRQFVRMLKIELVAVVKDFNEIIIKQFEKEWRDIFRDSNDKLDRSNKKIIEFFKVKNSEGKFEYFNKILRTSKYQIAKNILGLNRYNFNEICNYLWIKQLIFNETHPKTHIPPFDLHDKIVAIMEKIKGFFPKIKRKINENGTENEIEKSIDSFIIVTDKQNVAYVMYDDNDNLYNFNGVVPPSRYETDDEKIKKWEECNLEFKTINRVLYGMPDVHDIAVESIKEYRKCDDGEWNDIYLNTNKNCPNDSFSDEKINFKCFNSANYVLLVRFSEFKDHQHRILGLIGLHCKIESEADLEKFLLPKQLLMLLRQDIGKFIIKHHKNDEFSALRAAEVVKRFAYLAGHGRQTMQRLIDDDIEKQRQFYIPVIKTMEELQILYATKNLSNNSQAKEDIQAEFLKTFFPKNVRKLDSLKTNIESFVNDIYKTEKIENEVAIKENGRTFYDIDFSVDVQINKDFYFNDRILLFIIFELIINSKKNRWHCIENKQSRFQFCKNLIEICVKDSDNGLTIKIVSKGAKISDDVVSKVNQGKPIKERNDPEGIFLIKSILTHLGSGNYPISMSSVMPANIEHRNVCGEYCILYTNTITVKMKSIQQNGK